jgi:hypothetical protein
VPFVWLPELVDHEVTFKTFLNKAKLDLYGELYEIMVACGVLVQMEAHMTGFLSNQKKATNAGLIFKSITGWLNLKRTQNLPVHLLHVLFASKSLPVHLQHILFVSKLL